MRLGVIELIIGKVEQLSTPMSQSGSLRGDALLWVMCCPKGQMRQEIHILGRLKND